MKIVSPKEVADLIFDKEVKNFKEDNPSTPLPTILSWECGELIEQSKINTENADFFLKVIGKIGNEDFQEAKEIFKEKVTRIFNDNRMGFKHFVVDAKPSTPKDWNSEYFAKPDVVVK